MITITRDFFESTKEDCQKEILCEVPYKKDNPITKIAKGAFYDWENCRYVVIPPTVNEIDDEAFLWDKIKLIVSDTQVPTSFKGIVLPFNEYSLALLEVLRQVDTVEGEVHIDSEHLFQKRDKVNKDIASIIKTIEAEEKKLQTKADTLDKLYQELDTIFQTKQGLSESQLNLIEQETLSRIKNTLETLQAQEYSLAKERQEFSTTVKKGMSSIQEAFMDAKTQADKVVDRTQSSLSLMMQEKEREARNIKQKLAEMLDHLSAREEDLTQAVVDRALERVKEENPYKNINIYINNVIQGTAHKKLVHKSFEKVVKILGMHLHPLLVGPAGCGKNVILEQASEALGLDFYYVNDVTEEHKVMGFVDANGHFQTTQFFKAFTEGGLMMIDELDNSHPSALLAINAALGTGFHQYLAFPDGKLYPCHKDFYCAAAANTYGTGADMIYCGRSALDGASLNRFVPIFIDYDQDLENHLVQNTRILPLYWSVRKSIQDNKIRHVVSTRNIVNADKMFQSGLFNEGDIFDLTIIQSLTDDDLRIILNDLVKGQTDTVKNSFVYHLQRTRNISYQEYKQRNPREERDPYDDYYGPYGRYG